MADFPLPELAQLRERIRDLEAEMARLRKIGGPSAAAGGHDTQIAESEERFRVAFTTAPAALAITRVSDGKFLFVNPAFCRNSGYAEGEIIGRTFEDLGIYADEAQRQHVFEQLIAHGFIENDEFRYKTRTGELRVGLLSSRPITLGGEMCQLGMLIDITAAKRAEAERARLEERLRQGQKMEAIGRLAGGVAHDFNNMLTAIIANVELGLMHVRPGDPLHDHLLDIRDASNRAAKLTRQLLAFSRKQVIEPRPVDLSRKVDEMQTMLRRVIGEDISITFDLAPDLPRVMADPTQVEQVVLNLVVNARDAVAHHGSIAVATGPADRLSLDGEMGGGKRYVVLSVTDNGKGIAADVLPHVFEPFFSTKAERGTGLGLSMVDGIVTQHGGFVELDTSPDRGTTFRVFLPEAPQGSSAPEPAQAKNVASKRRGAIVLAEDDAAVREPTARLLERLGFTVHAAASAAGALELVRAHRGAVEILLTDMVMPAMSGHDLARAVRELLPDVAVVYMSGYPQDVIDRGGVLDPGVVLLRKPFGAEQLLESIALSRRGSPRDG